MTEDKNNPDTVNVNNPEELEKAVDDALVVVRAQVSGDWRTLARIAEQRRDECHTRGYHVVSCDDKKGDEKNPFSFDNLLICYHCELFFGKYDEIPYNVVPV
ncbi:hypothetical protein HY484_04865 [Candidatus Woesearchaeota archaeon]|nr:hypothetical protein [Candidatus Woesearchaeota archaeon]